MGQIIGDAVFTELFAWPLAGVTISRDAGDTIRLQERGKLRDDALRRKRRADLPHAIEEYSLTVAMGDREGEAV